jgi:carboxyl-terminal processing protease
MSPQQNESDRPAGRRLSGALLAALLALFGLSMALVGFMAGRATSPAQALIGPDSSLPTAASAPPTLGAPSEGVVELVTGAVAQPATATPRPTIQPTPTDQPTATATPTVEPSATIIVPTLAPPTPPPGSPLAEADFATFYEVWELLAGSFDGAMPPKNEIVESMISGSLDTLDDEYTRYIPPDIAERMRQDEDGTVEGIGALVIENDEGQFEIFRPLDGQPAELAGIKAGDILIEVDGRSIEGLSFDEVILLVRGPQGTSVNLKFLREGEPKPREFTIVRVRFESPVVEFEVLPDEMTDGQTIGYVRLTEFNLLAEEKLLEALDELLAQGATGIVFDLRDNPGGFVDQSVAVADAFLPEGIVLYERNIRGLEEIFRTVDGDVAETIPLVVLVNAGSASASEIVAGAIQDRGRAVLVGETTFGKGSVQGIHPLSDGSELRVTVARWYTPNNHTIDGVGIAPDIEVESPEDFGGPDDGQLTRAVEYLLTGQ